MANYDGISTWLNRGPFSAAFTPVVQWQIVLANPSFVLNGQLIFRNPCTVMSAQLKLATGWPSWMPVCCVVNVLMSCCCSLACLCSNRQHCCCSMVHQHIRLNLDPCPNLFT